MTVKNLANSAGTHRTLLVLCLVFLYYSVTGMTEVIAKIPNWQIVWDPPTVAAMGRVIASAILAVITALGVNINTAVNGGNS